MIKSDLFSFAYLPNWCPAGLPGSSNFVIQTIYRSLINTNETSGPPSSLQTLLLRTRPRVPSHPPWVMVWVWVGPPSSTTLRMVEKSFITLLTRTERRGFCAAFSPDSRQIQDPSVLQDASHYSRRDAAGSIPLLKIHLQDRFAALLRQRRVISLARRGKREARRSARSGFAPNPWIPKKWLPGG